MISVECELSFPYNWNRLILDANIRDDQEGDVNGNPVNDRHSDGVT